MIRQTRSQETLSTLVNDGNNNINNLLGATDTNTLTEDEYASDLNSLVSQDTLIHQSSTRIMGYPLSEYRYPKELPLVSHFLHTGISLYPSWQSLSPSPLCLSSSSSSNSSSSSQLVCAPILCRPAKLFNNIFNFTAPFLIIESAPKTVFCRVDFKIYSNHITYYVMTFPTLERQVYLLNNNSHSPSADFVIKSTENNRHGMATSSLLNTTNATRDEDNAEEEEDGEEGERGRERERERERVGEGDVDETHFRVSGVTGTLTAFALRHGLIQVHIMASSKGLLTENMCVDLAKKRVKLQENELSKLIQCQDRRGIDELMKNKSKKLVDSPVAVYFDLGDVKMKSGAGVAGGGNASGSASAGTGMGTNANVNLKSSGGGGGGSGGNMYGAGRYIKHGVIKIWDHLPSTTCISNSNSNNDSLRIVDAERGHVKNGGVSDEMMIISCVLMVLREQESRKYKGDKKERVNKAE